MITSWIPLYVIKHLFRTHSYSEILQSLHGIFHIVLLVVFRHDIWV
jgi:hypothetical protein